METVPPPIAFPDPPLRPSVPSPQPFPAAKVGIIAGVSAAMTLIAVAVILLVGRWALAGIAEQDRLRTAAENMKADQVISPHFKSEMVAYVDSVEKEHKAATEGWKSFQAQKSSTDAKEAELLSAAKTGAEIELEGEASQTQVLYPTCVEYAIGPNAFQKLSKCEKESSLDALYEIAAKTASK